MFPLSSCEVTATAHKIVANRVLDTLQHSMPDCTRRHLFFHPPTPRASVFIEVLKDQQREIRTSLVLGTANLLAVDSETSYRWRLSNGVQSTSAAPSRSFWEEINARRDSRPEEPYTRASRSFEELVVELTA